MLSFVVLIEWLASGEVWGPCFKYFLEAAEPRCCAITLN